MADKFYLTTYVYRVLSDGPMPDGMSLAALDEATESGDCVGTWGDTAEVTLTGAQAAKKLSEFGSEPGFFGLDEEGNSLDDQGGHAEFPYEEIRMESGDYFPTAEEARLAGYTDNQIWSVTESDGVFSYGPIGHYVNLLGYIATVEEHDGNTYYEDDTNDEDV